MLNLDSLIFKTSGEKTSLLVGEASQLSYYLFLTVINQDNWV
jgi:hypothetical protein